MEPRPLHEAHDGEGEGEANRSTTFPPSHEVDDDDDDSGGLPPSQDEALPPGWRPRGPNFPTSDGKLRPRTKQTALVKHPWPHLTMVPTRPDDTTSLTPQTANAATTLGALGEGEGVVEGGGGGGGVVGNHDEAITTTTTTTTATATTKPALLVGANVENVGVGWMSGKLPFSARKKERGAAPSLPSSGS